MAILLPRIVWGPAYDRTLEFRLPLHSPMPRRPWLGEVADAPSGEMDAWRDGLYAELEFELRWIPGIALPGQSGWYGAAGVEAWLAWARDKHAWRLHLDTTLPAYRTCKLVTGEEAREASKAQFYRLRAVVRDMSHTPFEI